MVFAHSQQLEKNISADLQLIKFVEMINTSHNIIHVEEEVISTNYINVGSE